MIYPDLNVYGLSFLVILVIKVFDILYLICIRIHFLVHEASLVNKLQCYNIDFAMTNQKVCQI